MGCYYKHAILICSMMFCGDWKQDGKAPLPVTILEQYNSIRGSKCPLLCFYLLSTTRGQHCDCMICTWSRGFSIVVCTHWADLGELTDAAADGSVTSSVNEPAEVGLLILAGLCISLEFGARWWAQHNVRRPTVSLVCAHYKSLKFCSTSGLLSWGSYANVPQSECVWEERNILYVFLIMFQY